MSLPRPPTRLELARLYTAFLGVGAAVLLPLLDPAETPSSAWSAGLSAGACLIGAVLAGTAARYLETIDALQLPEAVGLCRGARLVAWTSLLLAIGIALQWAGQVTGARVVHYVAVLIDIALCAGLFLDREEKGAGPVFHLNLALLSIFGSDANVFRSVFSAFERQLGVDIRSTWALTVVRRTLEPLVVSLAVVGWAATSLTVVAANEAGLVERFGIPSSSAPLDPGLHWHWPWPIDRVFRIPVRKVQTLSVGHEGEESGGAENVLWAREHAANEYTLLLGNGRDLITIDAATQFRIKDARAWHYGCQNPTEALRAIAYRAVMTSTVNRTLTEALSENVALLTERMRQKVQRDADALGLGVDILAFTVGGMHPPVAVAPDYQAVVSAELGKVTSVVNAQAYRNQTVPAAEATVIAKSNTARADGELSLARAAGEAWSFRTLESQYRAAPEEYVFRRRLETLEKDLAGRRFTVVDARIQRDGGALWVTQ
ncbi:MAG TPA: protease modulator HflK [Polyangiaceae bacterium]|jgi:regulator of protease activity HflC (stomatin/prohibitin superfamily)|nr:protease modulator HflK [Polyangiaceae bacterium]